MSGLHPQTQTQMALLTSFHNPLTPRDLIFHMTLNGGRDNTPDMMLCGTPSLHTTSPRSTILINPFRSRDTSIETSARTTLPAGSTVLVVVIEGDEMGCVAPCSSHQSEDEGEKGKAMDDHCCGNLDNGYFAIGT